MSTLQISEAQPQIDDIQTEVHQLETWLQGLQFYAQEHEHAVAALQLHRVLADLAHQMAPSLDKQGIQFQLDIADDAPPIQVDATLLQQVFHTVITNAQDAMPQGGALHIRVRHTPPSPFVDIEIRDTGHGMTSEQLRLAFQPFFTTKRRGLGLGLALTKRMVERQGGKMAIDSVEGEGTTVTVSFPLARQAIDGSKRNVGHHLS